ncbi:MAG: polymer-forming cytoskeletal protein [Acidobacteria bacterium]|nr:polymer-forming cytoskeletal protein [Acidobacteriota bacterium]
MRNQTRTNSSPAGRSEVEERRTTAWIGHGVVVEGRITSSLDLRIDGNVEGVIEVGNHVLTVGPRAAVKANLVARSILISGAVTGNVTATERVDLQATGSIEGDISAPRLLMVDGAFVKGKVNAGEGRKTKSHSG